MSALKQFSRYFCKSDRVWVVKRKLLGVLCKVLRKTTKEGGETRSHSIVSDLRLTKIFQIIEIRIYS